MVGSDFGEGEDQFFDARDELCSGSDLGMDLNRVSGCSEYEVWTKCPDSIRERRRTFMESSGLSSSFPSMAVEELGESVKAVKGRPKSCEAVIANVDLRDGSPSSSSQACTSSESEESVDESTEENEDKIGDLGKNSLVCRVQNSDNPKQYSEYVMEVGDNGVLGKLREVGSNRFISLEDFEKSSSRSFQRRNVVESKKKEEKKNWLRQLSSKVRKTSPAIVKPDHDDHDLPSDGIKPAMRKVRVNTSKKSSKEMTSLHTRQEFQAHKGSILTMKFSVDGKYLASAGKDCVVRVWKVNEDSRLDESDIPDNDPSCLYFPMNQSSKVGVFDVNKDKLKKLKRSRDLACAVLPPEVFWMLERPIHEFHGHKAEVLDLSWSKNGYLLSSSVDKTVRLWKVGFEGCQKVFSHKNYVTCVSFNPVDDNYFISGSIDGMVRIWQVSGCKVVDYIDVREIVTAVSYRPFGKKGIVGSISGNCYFLDIMDNHIRLGALVSLKGKKKKLSRRITGFQFCPSDSKKVMVTVADSLIKVLSDEGVICKFKGPWKAGIHVSASFTSDGKHIISASEDSNVCVWNYNDPEMANSGPRKIRSCESFFSDHASIAIPWHGTSTYTPTPEPRIQRAQTVGEGNLWKRLRNSTVSGKDLERSKSAQPSTLFPEARPRGSETWPEEKMADSHPMAGRSEYKQLMSMMSPDNMWGVVIVTAGTDGKLRVYQNYGLPVRT